MVSYYIFFLGLFVAIDGDGVALLVPSPPLVVVRHAAGHLVLDARRLGLGRPGRSGPAGA